MLESRSGLDITKPTGSAYTAYGSFGTATAGFEFACGGPKWGNFIAVNGVKHFLDPREFTPLHDKGNEENIFDRIDYMITQANTIHLNLNGVRTAPSPFGPAMTPCPANQFSSIDLQVPAPGKENDDHNPQRIAPRRLFDVAVGDDNLFRGDRYRWSLRFTVTNLADKVALYNYLSTFSGTHYVTAENSNGRTRVPLLKGASNGDTRRGLRWERWPGTPEFPDLLANRIDPLHEPRRNYRRFCCAFLCIGHIARCT